MKMAKILIAASLITLCFSCAGNDRVYEGMYNGFQSMERLNKDERPNLPEEKPMDYQQYKNEREKILNKDNNYNININNNNNIINNNNNDK